ncbi:MAG: hypothetical protein KME20_27715 [Kaiparowitsia implicata GSE-PSE-MK54-09C]|nr:hypothetical protein [Kaiparowitsia implicata GSE-PSE-MK54-09C]
MQRVFAEQIEWHTPWMERVLPNVVGLVELHPARTSSRALHRHRHPMTRSAP